MLTQNMEIKISAFSRLTQLTEKALRLYDEKGLLVPIKREITGYRYYTLNQIDKAIEIRILSRLGFSLNNIKKIINSKKTDEIEELFEIQIKKTNSTIQELNKAKKILLKKNLNEVFTMKAEKPIIKELPEIRAISKRVKGTYEKSISFLVKHLMKAIEKNNAKITGPIALLCYDEGYKEKNADIEIAIPVCGKFEKGDYEIKKFPAQKIVSLIHQGHPSEMDHFLKSYKRVYKFAEENKLNLKLPDRLLFLTNENQVKKDDTLTEIQYPIDT